MKQRTLTNSNKIRSYIIFDHDLAKPIFNEMTANLSTVYCTRDLTLRLYETSLVIAFTYPNGSLPSWPGYHASSLGSSIEQLPRANRLLAILVFSPRACCSKTTTIIFFRCKVSPFFLKKKQPSPTTPLVNPKDPLCLQLSVPLLIYNYIRLSQWPAKAS